MKVASVPDPLLRRLSSHLVGSHLVGHNVVLLVADKNQPGIKNQYNIDAQYYT